MCTVFALFGLWANLAKLVGLHETEKPGGRQLQFRDLCPSL